jgi:hypothetical protein
VAISRRILFKSTLAAIVTSGFRAHAQTADFSYKYASNLPVTHPLNVRAQEAADRIKGSSSCRSFPTTSSAPTPTS